MTRMSTRTLPIKFIHLILALAIGVLVGPVVQADEMSAWADEAQTPQVITTETAAPTHVSGKWEKWKSGWYFKQKDGSYATGFIQPNSEKRIYYLNSKGLMKTGWIKVKDDWYWAKANGTLHSGWKKLKGKWYYLDPKVPTHPAVTGFFSDGKARYYCQSGSCAMKTGWIKVGEKWYWANSSGALQKGWKKYNGKWYYLDPNDEWFAMCTGLFQAQGDTSTYWANSSGVLAVDAWVSDAGKTYYANASGQLSERKSFTRKGNDMYAYDDDGTPLSGWCEAGGAYFYADPNQNGKLATGWRKISGSWYYFDSNATMATGWRKVGGAWYYLAPGSGKMYENGWKWIGNVDYKFAKSGKMVGAWVDVPCYYQNPELPTGCESVALTNALRFYGFSISKTTIADSYLPRSGSNFVTAFTGDPHSGSGGQTCAPGIVNAANSYLKNKGSKLRASEKTGASFASLCSSYLSNGKPVIIWASIGYSFGGSIYASQTYNGRTYNAFSLSHTMVLCGYDDEAGVVWLSDSISGKVKMPYSTVSSLYNKHGKQAVVIS